MAVEQRALATAFDRPTRGKKEAGVNEAASTDWGLRWWKPRPAEWVVLAFWGWVSLRVAVATKTGEPTVAEPWRLEIVTAGLAVLSFGFARRYFALPWPGDRSAVKWLHRVLLVFFGLPALYTLAVHYRAGLSWLPPAYQDGTPFTIPMLAANEVFKSVAIRGLPGLLLWFALGIEAKQPFIDRPSRLMKRWFFHTADHVRDWLPPIALMLGYTYMGEVLKYPLVPDRDGWMQAIDRLLFFGTDPVRATQAMVRPWLSEWLAFCYAFYVMMYPLTFGGVLANAPRRAFQELAFAITLATGIGCTLYALVPVLGPLHVQTFDVSVTPYYMRYIKEQLIEPAAVARDCFPSLHTAATAVLAWACFRHVRPLFWLMLPMAVSIPLACVYLRYHYVADVLAGALLAAGVIWVTPKVMARWNK